MKYFEMGRKKNSTHSIVDLIMNIIMHQYCSYLIYTIIFHMTYWFAIPHNSMDFIKIIFENN